MSDTSLPSTTNEHISAEHLRALLDHHQKIADALRVTLAVLEAPAAAMPQSAADVMIDALAIDRERRERQHEPAPKPRGRPKLQHAAPAGPGRLERRGFTARLLQTIAKAPHATMTLHDLVGPHTTRMHLASLCRFGYLKKKGDRISRTSLTYPFNEEGAAQ
jgi:hypothetical protein